MKYFLQGFILGVLGVFGMVILGGIIMFSVNFLFDVLGDFWGFITSSALTLGLVLGTMVHSRRLS